MIEDSGVLTFSKVRGRRFDHFMYALGFESRSTKLVSSVSVGQKIFALKMPESELHAYQRNLRYAKTKQHRLIDDMDAFLDHELALAFSKSDKPLRIGFDISSVNRLMLVDVLTRIARFARPGDEIEIYYCPALYIEPDRKFPQIERLGPISPIFSSVDSDPTKPLCLVLGLGFEAGLSMGIISQLEPRLSYCLWGTGVEKAFDRAVKRANFDFEFTGFNTRVLPYDIKDPKGAFLLFENVVYGLTKNYRVIIVPMGPKLFTLLSCLVGMTYLEEVAVWRVQHSRVEPEDSLPSKYCVRAVLDVDLLNEFAARERTLTGVIETA